MSKYLHFSSFPNSDILHCEHIDSNICYYIGLRIGCGGYKCIVQFFNIIISIDCQYHNIKPRNNHTVIACFV